MRNSDGDRDVIRLSYMTSWSSDDDVHTEAGRRCLHGIDVKKFMKKPYIVSVLDDNSQCQNLNQPPLALLRIQPLQRQLKTLQKSL